MKSKKLPKKNIGDFVSKDEAAKKPGVKLVSQKRSKKPSIYDEMDDFYDNEMESEDDTDLQDDIQDLDDEDDLY
jgi:hypothetical protein